MRSPSRARTLLSNLTCTSSCLGASWSMSEANLVKPEPNPQLPLLPAAKSATMIPRSSSTRGLVGDLLTSAVSPAARQTTDWMCPQAPTGLRYTLFRPIFCLNFFFLDSVSHSIGWSQTCCVADSDLELITAPTSQVLRPQVDTTRAGDAVLETLPKTSCLLHNRSSN